MRNKLTPILANCAVLLAILGLSGVIAQARNIESADTINNHPAVETSLSDVYVGGNDIVIDEVNDAVTTVANDVLEIANLDNQIDQSIIEVESKTIDIDGVVSPIELAEAVYINAIAPVGGDIPPTIRS